MTKPLSTDEEKLLIAEALAAQKNSYCPYSKFAVGAALLMNNGQLFKGTNVENASYGATICAERSAICSAMSTMGPAKFMPRAIAVVADLVEPASPCGMCRQTLAEFGDFPVLLYSTISKKSQTSSVHQLLPLAFTPSHLEEYNNTKGKRAETPEATE